MIENETEIKGEREQGGAISHGREPKRCVIYSFKLDSFAYCQHISIAFMQPLLELKTCPDFVKGGRQFDFREREYESTR